MPRVEIPVTTISRSGATPPSQTTADATNDHYIANNDGRIFLEIISTDGSTQTVTVETPVVEDGLALDDQVISVPAGATRLAGPFSTTTFNQTGVGDENKVFINPSVSTNLKFRAYRV